MRSSTAEEFVASSSAPICSSSSRLITHVAVGGAVEGHHAGDLGQVDPALPQLGDLLVVLGEDDHGCRSWPGCRRRRGRSSSGRSSWSRRRRTSPRGRSGPTRSASTRRWRPGPRADAQGDQAGRQAVGTLADLGPGDRRPRVVLGEAERLGVRATCATRSRNRCATRRGPLVEHGVVDALVRRRCGSGGCESTLTVLGSVRGCRGSCHARGSPAGVNERDCGQTVGRPWLPAPSGQRRCAARWALLTSPIGQPAGEHRGPAVGQERQRQPGDRHACPRFIPTFSNDLEQRTTTATPDAISRPKASCARAATTTRPQHDEAEQEQQPGGPEEAELLPRHREDEVGLLVGDEAALGLPALEEALPLPAAGADRDAHLPGLVADPLRVGLAGWRTRSAGRAGSR